MKHKFMAAALVAAACLAGCSLAQSTASSTTEKEQTSQTAEKTETTEAAQTDAAQNTSDAAADAFKSAGFEVSDLSSQDSQETFKFEKDGETGSAAIYKFSDSNLAITKWNDDQSAAENNGYEIQTQDSDGAGSVNIYYNSSSEKYLIFAMNADTTAVYEFSDVTANTLPAVKDTLKALGAAE